MYPGDRESLRRMYIEAWRRQRQGLPLEPVHAQIADVVADHPEYHQAIEAAGGGLASEWTPAEGRTNPFLHMGMHLALRDQVATGRPPGIAAIHAGLLRRLGDPHQVEHRMMECLGAALWQAQRNGEPPDEAAYLECLRKL